MLIIVYSIAVYFYLYTVAEPKEDEFDHVTYESEDTLVYMQWYHLFGFLWAFGVRERRLNGNA